MHCITCPYEGPYASMHHYQHSNKHIVEGNAHFSHFLLHNAITLIYSWLLCCLEEILYPDIVSTLFS